MLNHANITIPGASVRVSAETRTDAPLQGAYRVILHSVGTRKRPFLYPRFDLSAKFMTQERFSDKFLFPAVKLGKAGAEY